MRSKLQSSKEKHFISLDKNHLYEVSISHDQYMGGKTDTFLWVHASANHLAIEVSSPFRSRDKSGCKFSGRLLADASWYDAHMDVNGSPITQRTLPRKSG